MMSLIETTECSLCNGSRKHNQVIFDNDTPIVIEVDCECVTVKDE